MITLAMSAAGAHGASAQTVLVCSVAGPSGRCSPTVTLDVPAHIVNPALLQLTVSPTSSTYTAATTDMNVSTGLATPSIVTLSVKGNRAWTVQANGNSAFWTASAGAWASKPVSDLVWSLTPAGATTAMSTTATTVTSGSPGSGSPGVSVYLRPVAHWTTDKPGTYSMTVTFTLTTP
jgi:phage tail sheath gpL-like